MKKHPLDKDMRCPKCKALVHPDHYEDGTDGGLYTPFWICVKCLHSWEIEDIEKRT